MLQHNVAQAEGHARGAHVAHAAMLGMHALCCGLPAAAMAAAALSGAAASGATSFSAATGQMHALLHAHEVWIIAGSALLVATGGVLELVARRAGARRGFPWLFAFSAACFAFNLAIIAAHRGV